MKKGERTCFEGKLARICARVAGQRRQYARRGTAFVMASVLLLLLASQGLTVRGLSLENTPICGQEEHVHTDACMRTDLTCEEEERGAVYSLCCPVRVHQHSSACYDKEHRLICGQAEAVVHSHNRLCYDANGTLVCNLPELEQHTHNDSCYSITKLLVCNADMGHAHSDACYAGGETVLTCGQEEREGHIHTEACVSHERGALICDLEENEEHSHSDACYTDQWVYTCGLEEGAGGHAHTSECYEQTPRVLICGQEEAPVHVHTDACYIEQRQFICDKLEMHTHTAQCYPDGDSSQLPICGKLELKAHNHDNTCAEVIDPGHTHTEDCYTQVLVCEIPVHVHDSSCNVQTESQEQEEVTPSVLEGESEADGGEEAADPEDVSQGNHVEDPEGAPEGEDALDPEDAPEGEDALDPEDAPEGEDALDPEDAPEGEDALDPEDAPEGEDALDSEDALEWEDGTALVGEGAMPMMFAAFTEGDEEDGENEGEGTSVGDPVPVEDFIKSVVLKYQAPGQDGFTEYVPGTELPGNASLELAVYFEGVPSSRLKDAGGKMSYKLPDFMRAVTIGSLTLDGEEVATVVVKEDTAILTFTGEYLKSAPNVNANFVISAKEDLSWIDQNNPGTLTIGDVTISIGFEKNLVAKYGDVQIEKSVNPRLVQTESGNFIQYTIQVTAGQDGGTNVQVVDTFTESPEYIQGYEGIRNTPQAITDVTGWEETSSNQEAAGGEVYLGKVTEQDGVATITPDESGTMVWKIGNMEPNEVRTLTYLVRVGDAYVGGKAPDVATSCNAAKPYCDGYPRNDSTAVFTLRANMDMFKSRPVITPNEDGTLTLRYLVTATAAPMDPNVPDNSYILHNVEVRDGLDIGRDGRNKDPETEGKLLPYILFSKSKIWVYPGKLSTDVLNNPQPLEGTTTLEGATVELGDSQKNFTCKVGELAPGESVSVVYEVTVEPGFFAMSGNEDPTIHNVARVYCGGTETSDGWNANNYLRSETMQHKQWSRKLIGQETQQDIPVSMADGRVVVGDDASFTVPKGSFQYTVIVNEAGDWNVSNALMKDQLDQEYMQFVGYARVDVFNTQVVVLDASSDEAMAQSLEGLTPNYTVWVKVEGQRNFEITPAAIGLDDGEYAVRLTYYAKLVDPPDDPRIAIKNTFTLSGQVGIGGYKPTIPGIEVKCESYTSSGTYFHVNKYGWYYNPKHQLAPKESTDYEKYGDHYWVIQVDAGKIPKGTSLKDNLNIWGVLYDSNGSYTGSFVGAYKGTLPKLITEYANWDEVNNSGLLTRVEGCTAKRDNGQQMTVTFTDEVLLGMDESLYIILWSRVNGVVAPGKDVITVNNSVSHSFNGSDWFEDASTFMELSYYNGIIKGCNGVFTWDGSSLLGEKVSEVDGVDDKTKEGTYVQWYVKVNPVAELEGSYLVTDYIPDGMELSDCYLSWKGEVVSDAGTERMPSLLDLDEEERWVEHYSNVKGFDTYYYTKGNQVCWRVTKLTKYSPTKSTNRNQYSVVFRIICRVTDPNVLFGGDEGTFTNRATIANIDGDEIGEATSTKKVSIQTLKKITDETVSVSGGIYPFELTLNPLGEDLLPGADTIKLIDTMSETLKMNLESLQVTYWENGGSITFSVGCR